MAAWKNRVKIMARKRHQHRSKNEKRRNAQLNGLQRARHQRRLGVIIMTLNKAMASMACGDNQSTQAMAKSVGGASSVMANIDETWRKIW